MDDIYVNLKYKKISKIIDEEIEREKIECDFPHTYFGRMTRDDLCKFIKKYKNETFKVIGISKNLKLGELHDDVSIETPEGIIEIKRMFLNHREVTVAKQDDGSYKCKIKNT